MSDQSIFGFLSYLPDAKEMDDHTALSVLIPEQVMLQWLSIIANGFRKLFVAFSSYTYVNMLKKIN
ncbi:hypothetical protein OROMI_009408 [Orobanche minor]